MRTDSSTIERQLVQGCLWHLSPEASDRWETCKSSHRFMSFQGKQLVVYSLFLGKPVILSTLTCKSVRIGFAAGLETTWANELGEELDVGATPIEVAPSVFLWHTFQTDLQYRPHKGVFSIRFSMLYKCRHNPSRREENCLYIQEKAAFDSEFPA